MCGRCLAIAILATLVLSGCAGRQPILGEFRSAATIELSDTPFFPQSEFQCGPAALATLLHAAGRDLHPDTLAVQVYLPGRRGSLQVELLAATRRAGLIPYRIDPTLDAVLGELEAGRPVLVLQNLGLAWWPVWHYAVVIGADPRTDSLILRSGLERRQLTPAGAFLRSWKGAGGWAMVVLQPGGLPAQADPQRYVEALALAESQLSPEVRVAAYRAALARWPRHATAQFGLAHALHAAGELHAAEEHYRQLLDRQPHHVAALNNLAGVLSEGGCFAAARATVRHALKIARTDIPALLDALAQTLAEIPAGDDRTAACPVLDAGIRR